MKPQLRQLIYLEGVSSEMWESMLENPKLNALHHFSRSQRVINELSSNHANLISIGTASSFLDHKIHSSYTVENNKLRIAGYKDRKALYVWEILDLHGLQTVSVGWPANYANPRPKQHLADVFGTDLSDTDKHRICDKEKDILDFWLSPSELDDAVVQQFIKLDDPRVAKFKSILAEFISKQSVYLELIQGENIVFSTIHLSLFAQLKAASFSDYVIANTWLLVNAMVEQFSLQANVDHIDLLINDSESKQLTFLTQPKEIRSKGIQDWGLSLLKHFGVTKVKQETEKETSIEPITMEHDDLDFLYLTEKRNSLFCRAEALEKVHNYRKALKYWEELSLLFPELEAIRSNYCRCLLITNNPKQCLSFLEEHRGFEGSIIFQAYEILANIALLKIEQAFSLLEKNTKKIEFSEYQPGVGDLRFLCYFRQWRTLKLTCDKILNWQDNYHLANYFSCYAKGQLENATVKRVQQSPFSIIHQQWVSEWSIRDPQEKISEVNEFKEIIISALDSKDLDTVKLEVKMLQDQGTRQLDIKFVEGKDIFKLSKDSYILIIVKDIDTWASGKEIQHLWSETPSLADQIVFWEEIQHRWLSACRENFNNVIETCDPRLLDLSPRLLSLLTL